MSATTPTTKQQLREIITRALEANYTSTSCMDGIRTGNHYQSVTLGDVQSRGFRTNRLHFLNQIDFAGKKVLDLGSNLGEISRAARDKGAYLVDGFEYDSYFIEIANLANAYNGATRVSFFQRDITDPSVYRDHYDIVIAFSVYSYIRSVLDEIANVTDLALVLESHKVEDNFDTDYLKPLSEHFPVHKVLGESDWARPSEFSGRRLVAVFAKDQSALDSILLPPPVPGPATPTGYIDVGRTNLHARFFETFSFDTPEQLLAAVDKMQLDVDALAQSRDAQTLIYNGWVYWLIFLKGYLQFATLGVADANNAHYQYLVNYFGPRNHDPGLLDVLKVPRATTERISRRFRDLDQIRRSVGGETRSQEEITPVTLVTSSQPINKGIVIYDTDAKEPICVRSLDGHHRLFAARLCGLSVLPYKVIRDSEVWHDVLSSNDLVLDGKRLEALPNRTKGHIDRINGVRISHPQAAPMVVSSGQPVRVEGWAVDRSSVAAGGVFVTANDTLHVWAGYGWERPDVAEYLGEACRHSGFSAEIPAGSLAVGPHQISLRVVTHDRSGFYEASPQMEARIAVD